MIKRCYRPTTLLAGAWMSLLVCSTWAATPTTPSAGQPDLSIGAAQYPQADAIILRWDQDWTIGADGGLKRRDHQWVKLLSNRSINRFADPRIEFNADEDEVVVHTVQTYLVNGEVLPAPAYNLNIGAAHDVAGWPAYAAWRERIVSFSGIEPGVTLELDYEVITKPGVLPWVSSDIRLDDDIPIVDRTISVTAPTQVNLAFWSNQPNIAPQRQKDGAAERLVWKIGPLPAAAGVAQAPSWRERSPRLVWTTAGNASAWTKRWLEATPPADTADEAIAAFARKAVEKEQEPAGQLRALAEAWRKRFQLLTGTKTLRRVQAEPPGAVFARNYGNYLESAGALRAGIAALGFTPSPAVAVDEKAWRAEAPADEAFAGIVFKVDLPDGPVWISPEAGYFDHPDGWGGHLLLTLAPDGQIATTGLPKRGAEGSTIAVTGRMKVAKDGKYSGDLRLRLSGAFFSPDDLRTADAQKKLVEGILGRAFRKVELASFAMQNLSPCEFEATVKLAEDKTLPARAKGFALDLGDAPMARKEIPLPLDRSYRDLPVDLVGPFREQLRVEVELADGATAAILPAGVAERSGPWGKVSFEAVVKDKALQLDRRVEVVQQRLSAKDFAALREAVLELEAPASTTICIVP
jgi:hypothetical protein